MAAWNQPRGGPGRSQGDLAVLRTRPLRAAGVARR